MKDPQIDEQQRNKNQKEKKQIFSMNITSSFYYIMDHRNV